MCAVTTILAMLFAMAVLIPAAVFGGLLYVLTMPYPGQRRVVGKFWIAGEMP
jgi:hypothetical protein